MVSLAFLPMHYSQCWQQYGFKNIKYVQLLRKKSRIVDVYPPPKFDKVIEPFAGSARYALKYWQKEVLLVDKYDVITDIWTYLINATEKDIEAPTLFNELN